MTRLLLLPLWFSISLSALATEQAPDRLVMDGDTLRLHALPFEHWRKQHDYEKPLFSDSLMVTSTGCWRGYIAHWEVIDGRLFLTAIYNADHSAAVDLDTLFPGRLLDGRVPADWFSDTVTAYHGRLIYYEHMGFSSIYEHELELVFADGRLTDQTYFDNSLSKNTPMFMGEGYRLTAAIDSLIDWRALPTIEKTVRVMLHVRTDELGQVGSIVVSRGHDAMFDGEAVRVARLLTRLPVIYKRGKFVSQIIFLPCVFTPEKQRRYASLPVN